MRCPECKQTFEGLPGACPHCAAGKGVVKTSTILISSRGQRNVYRSVEEVPEALKRELIRSTNGLNSATILIADRQGREELAKAIRNLPVSSSDRPDESKRPERPKPTFPQIAGLLALLMAAALIWLLFR